MVSICAEISILITVQLDRGCIFLNKLRSQILTGKRVLSHEQVDGF